MPTIYIFEKYPPFPNDVECAELQRISFAKLLAQDASESDALFKACKEWGFFVFDFQGCPEGEAFIQKAAAMLELDIEIHKMKVEELVNYAYKPPHSLFG